MAFRKIAFRKIAFRAAPVRPRARRRIGAPGQVLYAKLRRGGVVGVAGNAHDDNVFRFPHRPRRHVKATGILRNSRRRTSASQKFSRLVNSDNHNSQPSTNNCGPGSLSGTRDDGPSTGNAPYGTTRRITRNASYATRPRVVSPRRRVDAFRLHCLRAVVGERLRVMVVRVERPPTYAFNEASTIARPAASSSRVITRGGRKRSVCSPALTINSPRSNARAITVAADS